jgi:hypothetical protein
LGTFENLELMAVEMPWMKVGVEIVDDDLDDLIVLHNKGVNMAVD